MIQPTVGRKVWFYHSLTAAMDPSTQPQDATVVYVINDRLVNLRVSDHNGDQFPRLAVQLYQDDDSDPTGPFACWMPYQSKVAKSESIDPNVVKSLCSEVSDLTSRIDKQEKVIAELSGRLAVQPLANAGVHPDNLGGAKEVPKPSAPQVTK